MTFPNELLSQCWFLAGPTACGKTATSLHLAERLNAEIIALDAMTLYRGMDIGTAKPSIDERSRVRHHLVDILDPHHEFSLAEYLSAAASACREILTRGRTPLFVGGTGLYLRGILRGLFEGPAADWSIRERLENVARLDGATELHKQLQRIDPVSAERLHPNDQRRVIRAIEVFELTGQPISMLQKQGPRPANESSNRVFWLDPPRDWLYRRIDLRVENMFAEGLVDEVRRLIEGRTSISHTARQALGYKEVIDWLEHQPPNEPIHMSTSSGRSDDTAGQLIAVIQTRTRQFAKRQHTWFRNLEECRPISILGRETPEEVAALILKSSNSRLLER